MFSSLTPYERSLVTDAEVMLTKNRIIAKVVQLFEHLYEFYKPIAEQGMPGHLPHLTGKISKGEKYEGLPYVVLDFPRIFSTKNIFAIRSLFWWGHDMSITLHLSGDYLQQYAPVIKRGIGAGNFHGWYLQTEGNPWQHAVRSPYQLVTSSKDFLVETTPFLKLAKKIPLSEWDQSDQEFVSQFSKLLQLF